MDTKNKILVLILCAAVYFALRNWGGAFGHLILYPINILVTFLHESGHAIGSLITGGGVHGIEINSDGSGFCRTSGGNRGIILMGGYIGSAILGNILLYIGITRPYLSEWVLKGLSVSMFFVSIFWFNSLGSSLILGIFGIALFFIANRTSFSDLVLLFFGTASVLYVIQDFNIGPSSDLSKYSDIIGLFSTQMWSYIWLVIVVIIFIFNLKFIFSRNRS